MIRSKPLIRKTSSMCFLMAQRTIRPWLACSARVASRSDPQTGAADEVETAEIDDQMPLTAVDVLHDDRFERAGVPAVQASDGEQHEHIVMPFFRNFDIHR